MRIRASFCLAFLAIAFALDAVEIESELKDLADRAIQAREAGDLDRSAELFRQTLEMAESRLDSADPRIDAVQKMLDAVLEKGSVRPAAEDEMKILQKLVKQRRESAEIYRNQGNICIIIQS